MMPTIHMRQSPEEQLQALPFHVLTSGDPGTGCHLCPEDACMYVQIGAWHHSCGVVLPPAERAALIASGHAQILSDTLAALDREGTAAAQSRMRACACKIASSVPMASRPTEYSGGQVRAPAC